jgi:hypothetical protein
MEFLENQGCAPDPKSGQFLWEAGVSGLKMNIQSKGTGYLLNDI